MRVWRIARAAYQALDGEGARLYGGRWNPEGLAVVYTSTTLALAALEYLIHVDPALVPTDLVAMAIDVPEDVAADRVDLATLPADWREAPDHPACLEIGEAWAAAGKTLALRVPSAVVPEEENLLINPLHRDAARITVVRVRPFAFDPRLLA